MLVNVKKVVQFDAVERQALANQVSAEYGSLAFMYAKSIFKGDRSIIDVNERFHEQIGKILDYVKQNGYDLILD